MTQWDFAWYVCVCVNVFVVLVVVVAGMVVCGSYITMETVALSCWEDVDAGVSTALAAERSNMATTKSTGPLGRCLACVEQGTWKYFLFKVSFAANFTVYLHMVLPLIR